MVRHAYFTGADKPYEKLKKTLKAQIDEAVWSSLYSTFHAQEEASGADSTACAPLNRSG